MAGPLFWTSSYFLTVYVCVCFYLRFHIHLYNQDSLIGCVLPYHETKLFVRVIQLLNIKSPTHKWHWLDPIRVKYLTDVWWEKCEELHNMLTHF